jgi:hypothetical protein
VVWGVPLGRVALCGRRHAAGSPAWGVPRPVAGPGAVKSGKETQPLTVKRKADDALIECVCVGCVTAILHACMGLSLLFPLDPIDSEAASVPPMIFVC